MSAATKIAGLTRSNVDALAAAVWLEDAPLVTTATTAEWLGWSPAQAITWLDKAMGQMPTKGHPRASLHAVRRKLANLVPASEPLKEELPDTPAAPTYFRFAVWPVALDGSFDTFVLEVPTLQGQDVAARRAWWSAFHQLGPQGYEPEQFGVCELLEGDVLGRVVESGGLTERLVQRQGEYETPWTGGWPA